MELNHVIQRGTLNIQYLRRAIEIKNIARTLVIMPKRVNIYGMDNNL